MGKTALNSIKTGVYGCLGVLGVESSLPSIDASTGGISSETDIPSLVAKPNSLATVGCRFPDSIIEAAAANASWDRPCGFSVFRRKPLDC